MMCAWEKSKYGPSLTMPAFVCSVISLRWAAVSYSASANRASQPCAVPAP